MSDTLEIGHGYQSVNTTVTTTTETLAVGTAQIASPRQTVFAVIFAMVQLTTGVATTGVTLRLRRGVDPTDPTVGEANVVTIGAAAGGTEMFSLLAREELVDAASVRYTAWITQAAATGNGTILQAAILALLV
jgi:hypothetical protein